MSISPVSGSPARSSLVSAGNTRPPSTLTQNSSSSFDIASLGQPGAGKAFAAFEKLEQRASSNPEQFKQVTLDLAQKLKTAAGQSSDPQQSEFLNKLSQAFVKSSESGQLTPPEPPAGAPPFYGANDKSAAYGAGSAPTDSSATDLLALFSPSTQSADSQQQQSNATDDLLNSLFDSVS
jgi:hypothetical protein